MLKLQNIKKDYSLGGGMKVEALKGVDLCFRKSEFVSILGPSGCGKTTLLNIIGGLDRPTSGALFISGRSTENYGSRDWDTYRNHSIGFVFQTYNLIPHMTVLANVELAPTISGIPRAERRKLAVEALQKVGLGDQLRKKPNQLSGGQMQRVAIARALVNDPEILLADEPTGALDTKTSVQIMEILREIAQDRLIIMVTHNPELAEEYSTRIVRLKDGLVVDDSNPYSAQEESADMPTEPKAARVKGKKRSSMSFFTAFGLSFRNLLTKKARTILTSFAGSIGIIGIAAILAMSSGMQAYIDKVQEDTLSSYPVYLLRESADTTAIFSAMTEARQKGDKKDIDRDLIYPDDTLVDLFKALSSKKNHDLASFKKYLETHKDKLKDSLNAVSYSYDLNVDIYASLPDGEGVMQTNPSTIFDYMGKQMSAYAAMFSMSRDTNFFSEILEGRNGEIVNPVVKSQYDVLEGRWPASSDELVLILDADNGISNVSLYALGVKDPSELESRIEKAMAEAASGEKSDDDDGGVDPIPVKDLIGKTFTLVKNTDYFVKSDRTYRTDGKEYPIWNDVRNSVDYDEKTFLAEHGKPLTVVGVIKRNPEATTYSIGTPVGYTAQLTREIISYNNASEITAQQNETPGFDVFSGVPFEDADLKPADAEEFLSLLPEQRKAELLSTLQTTVSASITEETLPQILSSTDDAAFAMIVKTFLPSKPSVVYTKEQTDEFLATLSDAQKSQLLGVLAASGAPGVTAETLPDALRALPDDGFARVTATFTPKDEQPSYGKDDVPAFLEALGSAGRTALVNSLKSRKLEEKDLAGYLKQMPEDQFSRFVKYYLGETTDLESNLLLLGYQDDSRIVRISLYAADFKAKDQIKNFVKEYNDYAKSTENLPAGERAGEVEVTDLMGSLLSGVNTIINVISIVLIVFVQISLFVSSIMIAIITYISVLERIKEIGILRSLGASRTNVSSVFIAETLIEGFISGVLGVGVTLLLCLIANPIIHKLTKINSINAFLPPAAGFILVAISVVLTVLAGVVPAIIAAHKDPVIALRSE